MADRKIQEEARLRYPKVIGKIIATGDLNEYRRDSFITGAEWQKEQMLKDAVKGTVCKDKKCVWIELIPNALPDYEDIEPVKCVVIKED